ncbi:ABC transporter permease [Pseudomaricurvus alkylphenolicus]|uniref:ABC transporter permease n=1 Tax=Pseudomaricurvus alkylphenolicus TaxID=1306991 RepID=UPI001F0CE91D|nr:FtsX-like permease family protein [Pseudomaricurvus alkylphenolicus]
MSPQSMLLPLRLLWRNWRSGEIRILAGALVLAVTVVTCIAVFTNRLETTLVAESHTFLGANRIVRSSQPIPEGWQALADEAGCRTARTTQFASMVFAGERMHLAAVKAVTAGYPLVGHLTISEQPFATDPLQMLEAQTVPAPGEAWADSRLLPLLDIELGETLSVGEKDFTVTRVIIDEPDRGSSFALYGARLLINDSDLAATEVIQPGSRIRYHWMLSGSEIQLQSLLTELKPRLTPHQRVMDVESAQQGLANTLTTARKFLLLSAMIGVLLAGVAISIAARRFAGRHVEQVALMKSLGASGWAVRNIYGIQLVSLGLVTSLAGLVLGHVLQEWIAKALASLYPVELMAGDWTAYGLGLLTGMVCLMCFVVPPLWHLPMVPPIKILRRELEVKGLRFYWQSMLGLLALVFLIALFSQDLWLTASVVSAVVALLTLVALFAFGLLALGRRLGSQVGNIWRLALSGLQRNLRQSIIQMMVFALAVMLLLTLTNLRTNLINDWQLQLPPETPNHFLLNITPAEVADVESMMRSDGLEAKGMYPMVRGRLTHINGEIPSQEIAERAEVLRREANLSWTESLADDNKLVKGVWWDQWFEPGVYGVSVEEEIAGELGLSLGDDLRFSVGGLRLEARVASIRSLKWDSMNPNFYFLFSPGALDSFSPTYLTSVYLPQQDKLFINDLLQQFPSVLVIEMDRVIAQVQSIVTQVSFGVELMLWLVLLGGFLVMWAAVSSSMEARMQEAALLRALGSSRNRLLGSLWIEFSVLGFLSGIMAAVGAEVLILSIQKWVLEMPLQIHWMLMLWGVIASTALIGVMGVISCRRVMTTPPALILRELS